MCYSCLVKLLYTAKHSRGKLAFFTQLYIFPTNYGLVDWHYKHTTAKVFQWITIFHSKRESFPFAVYGTYGLVNESASPCSLIHTGRLWLYIH